MPLLLHLTRVSAMLAESWLAAFWQGLLLVGGVAVLFRALPGWSASRRSLVWLAVLGLLVSMHLLPVFGGVGHGILLGKAGQQTAWMLDARWGLALAGVWFAVSAFRGARLLVDLVRVQRIGRRATPLTLNPGLRESLGDVRVRIGSSSSVTRPCVVGYRRPRILLPEGLAAELSGSELRQVLLHEVEHIRRNDHWVNLLQKVLLAVFPLSPALLLVERQLCMERELACDDRVMRLTGARKSYAACLARIAQHHLLGQGAALVLGAWDRRPALVRRVERMLRTAPVEMTGWRARAAAGAVLLLSVAGTVALVQVPEPIRFTSSLRASAPTEAASFEAAEASSGGFRTAAYGKVQMVKANFPLPATQRVLPPARLPRRHPHRVSPASPLSLTTSRPTPRLVRMRPVQVLWRPGSGASLPDRQAATASAVLYLVPTPQGWLVIEI